MSDFTDSVNKRAQLLIDARDIAPDVLIAPEDSDATVRAKVVSATRGPKWIDGKCDDYILGVFRATLEKVRSGTDPVRDVLLERTH